MAKTTVSHRLDGELLARADAYAKERGSTRSVLIEAGLRMLLDVAKGGVPDLPSPEERRGPRAVTPQGPIVPSLLGLRQKALNDAKDRASR